MSNLIFITVNRSRIYEIVTIAITIDKWLGQYQAKKDEKKEVQERMKKMPNFT